VPSKAVQSSNITHVFYLIEGSIWRKPVPPHASIVCDIAGVGEFGEFSKITTKIKMASFMAHCVYKSFYYWTALFIPHIFNFAHYVVGRRKVIDLKLMRDGATNRLHLKQPQNYLNLQPALVVYFVVRYK